MLVVLEGCDGSGKSTLARSLAKILDAEIIHCTSQTPNDFEFFNSIIEESKNKNIIADRFCYGQFVYQEEEDRPLGTIENLHKLERKMKEAGAKVILVEAPYGVIESRLRLRRETLINGLTVSQVCERFYDLLNFHSIMGDDSFGWQTGGEL